MFLAVRELRHARIRYLLIGLIIALVAWLVFLLSGLANGLATDNGASLSRMKATGLVFQNDTRLFLHRSILPESTVASVAAVEGVIDATPLGHLTVTVLHGADGDRIDATILGIDPASFLAPGVNEGVALAEAGTGGVVVDESFTRFGVAIGDTLTVSPVGTTMTVVGFTSGQKYNHLPVIFMPVEQWRAIKFPTAESAGGIDGPISAVAIQGGEGVLAAVQAAVPGVETADRQTTIENLPGYSAEMSTVRTILVFLFFIAALVLAVFFYVLTLQKTSQFGVLKALGASTRALATDLLGQVLVLTVIGVAAGAGLAYVVAALIPAEVPFALSNRLVLFYSIVLLAVGAFGSIMSLIRIARIDPLIAIGRVD